MKVGDIVRLKPGHQLEQLIEGNCVIVMILEVEKYVRRYHITPTDGKGFWVFNDEVISVSEIREEKLNKLGL